MQTQIRSTHQALEEWLEVLDLLSKNLEYYGPNGAKLRDRAVQNIGVLARSMSYDLPNGLRDRMVIALVNHPVESDPGFDRLAFSVRMTAEQLRESWSLHS